MKNFLLILAMIALTLGGIYMAKKEAFLEFFNEAKTSYANVAEETNKVISEAKEAKEKVEETIGDVKEAAQKVQEAKEAIDKVTK